MCRIWFWVSDPSYSSSSHKFFQWPRDSIYGAILLLGVGGAIVHVISMSLIAYVIGPYAVSNQLSCLLLIKDIPKKKDTITSE